MSLVLIMILIIAAVLYYSAAHTFTKVYEKFTPFDASYYYESCKNLIINQNKVNKLESTYCNSKATNNNKININNKQTCYDEVERKIMLDQEQNNWCSKITPEQQKIIVDELSKQVGIPIEVVEGPEFINKQLKNIDPVGMDRLYAEI